MPTGAAYRYALMTEETRITLRYEGPSVADNTLPLEDVLSALQGFSGAYNKVANLRNDRVAHQLRVSAVQPGSFELVILAWLVLGQTPGSLQNLEMAYDATRWVVERLFRLIDVKKHAQNQPVTFNVKGNGNVLVVVNAQGAQLAIPPELVDLIKEKTLDGDLSKIVAPLEAGKVDVAEITAQTDNQPTLRETVNSDEREYFGAKETETIQDTSITGRFISLNKDSHRGTFELQSGKHIPYRYNGPSPDMFPSHFARKGPVHVEAAVTFNENLDPTYVEIRKVTHLQTELPLSDSHAPTGG
jgi:hypothetical protein